jgi:hypothetical protein
MPLLNSKLLSNWYKISVPYYNSDTKLFSTPEILVESFTQSKVQDSSNKGMIQGDIGVRVMDVGTLYYTSTLSGPIIVAERSEFKDLFNLISSNITYQRLGVQTTLPYTDNTPTLLLKSAQIQVTTEAVKATANFEGDYALANVLYNGNTPTDVNLLARTARFYDTLFYFGSVTNNYPVLSGDININFDIDKNFFLGQGQGPYFSIRGYNATGNVKIALKAEQYADLVSIAGSYQTSGRLSYNGINIGVSIANYNSVKNLNLGSYFVINKIEFSMQQNSIITATLEFNAFFNSSASLTTFE